jgi:hypothetical protein
MKKATIATRIEPDLRDAFYSRSVAQHSTPSAVMRALIEGFTEGQILVRTSPTITLKDHDDHRNQS